MQCFIYTEGLIQNEKVIYSEETNRPPDISLKLLFSFVKLFSSS